MEHQAFRYDFTIKELIYFLFKKKKCARCGGKLEKRKGYETVRGAIFNNRSDPFFVQNAKVKHYVYIFTCRQCGAQYLLKDLVK